MKLEALRAACVIIEGNGVRVLCDPWLDDTAYYGAWAHYPPYEWKEPLKYDYIYISHIHPDHMSPTTMRKLAKKPVLIHKFKAKFLRKKIEELGFEVIELDHAEAMDLGGLKIRIFAADDCDPEACMKFFGCTHADVAATQIDSMAIFDDGKEVYANVNDCPYLLSKGMLGRVRKVYPKIDVALVAYAGAGPYPQCFNMSNEEKLVRAEAKMWTFMQHVNLFAAELGALQVFPFAGDYLLQGRLAGLNKYRGIPHIAVVHRTLEEMGHSIFQKDVTDYPDPFEQECYINDVLAHRKLDYEHEKPVAWDTLVTMMMEARKRVSSRAKEIGLSTKTVVYVDSGAGGLFRIRFDGNPVVDVTDRIYDEKYIRMTVDSRLLQWLLMGPKFAHWNNCEIGSHIMFDRKPDKFERGISQVMSYFHV